MHRFRVSLCSVRLVMTFAAAILLASSLFAQTQSGNLFGTVTDNNGDGLPGVTVTVNSGGFQQTFVTEINGAFHFLRLVPGRYRMTAELSGFAAVARNVDVNLGANTEIKVKLVQTVSETITVTAATPLVDTRETGTSAVITQQELEQLPTARDPWVMLQQSPGILMDRVNVGGNKSGQQSYFVSKGVERSSAGWSIDGVNVTEMDETGTTTFYYDFGSLQEFQVVTSSSDPSVRTPGAQVNMVTKRGTNDFTGSGRYFWTDHSLQAKASMPGTLREGNKIENVTEFGGDVGGPVVRDRLWFYGAYSQNDIDNITLNYNFPQKTVLTNWTGKFTAQPSSTNNANLYYMFSDKTVNARGLDITHPPEVARKQTGPGWVAKAEDTHMFSSNFSLTGMFAHVDSGYKQAPRGGMDTEPYWYNDTDYCGEPGTTPDTCYGWHVTNRLSQQWIKQNNLRGDASNFFSTGSVDHELTWGLGYRDAPSEWLVRYPGNQTWAEFYDDGNLAAFTREAHPLYTATYMDAYVGDRVILGNVTLQGGFRYDLQRSWNKKSTVEANPLIPDILSATSYPGDPKKLEWKSLMPKVSATYAFGGAKQTVVRGAYNRYADQLGSSDSGANNPFYDYQVLYYNWQDLNNDRRVQVGEVDFSEIYDWSNIDPNNLGAGGVSVGRIDYANHKPTTTDELLVGVQHELTPGFALGASYTYRLRKNFIWSQYEKTRGAGDFYTPADYVLASSPFRGVMPDGSTYSIPYYQLKSGVPRPTYYVTRNRPDYEQHYSGLELTAQKRMTNRWEMRAQLTLSDWTQKVGSAAVQNPSPLLVGDGCYTCDGSAVASSSGEDGYINARWAYTITGLYDLPWQDVVLGAVVSGREGYINGYNVRQRVDRVYNRYVINNFDDYRFPNLFQLDLRAAKKFSIAGGTGLEVAVDAFNVTNQRTILWRDYTIPMSSTAPSPTPIQEMQSPRILRLNARVTF